MINDFELQEIFRLNENVKNEYQKVLNTDPSKLLAEFFNG